MSMNHVSIIFSSTLTGYLRLFISVLVVFFLTPKIIQALGMEAFGLWTVVFSVLGLFEWLDLGFFPAIIKYVSQCRATNAISKRNGILSTIALSYGLLALGGTLCVALISLFLHRIFEIPPSYMREAMQLMALLTVRTLLLGIPLALYRGILFGEQHMALVNLNTAFFTLASGIFSWWCLDRGAGLVTLAWINLGSFLLESLVYVLCAYGYVPQLKLSWGLVDFSFLREVSSFNFTQFVANTSSMLIQKTGPLIVQVVLSLSYVTLYAIPLKIVGYLYMLIKQFTNSLAPSIVHLEASGAHPGLVQLWLSCTKIALALATLLLVGMVIFGQAFMSLWVGDAFKAAVPTLWIMLAAMWVSTPEIVASEVLVMTGHHLILARYFLIQAGLNFIFSIALALPLGMVGVALGTLISALYVAFVVARKACAVYKVSWKRYLREAILPVFLPALGQALLTYGIATLQPPNYFLLLFLEGIPGVLLFFVLFWHFSMSSKEREVALSLFRQ